MAELVPRNVLVTGSSRGIGLELVKQLIGKTNHPEKIFATCRDPEGPQSQVLKKLAEKHKEIIVLPLDVCKARSMTEAVARVTELVASTFPNIIVFSRCAQSRAMSDVSKPPSIKAAAAKVTARLKGAGLNLLINNAGIVNVTSTLETVTPEDMLEVYQTNVIGSMLVSQTFLPLLKKGAQESPQKGMSCNKAAIVNMTSIAGSIATMFVWEMGQVLSYRCSKAALNMLSKCQSLEYAKDGILCIPLHPGWLQTDMGSAMAPMKVEEGVQKILDTLAHLSEKDAGVFMDQEGKVIPW